jgi:hypothetical protein
MNLSISSSEANAGAWGRWLLDFLGAMAVSATLIFAFVLIVDPYDSGRTSLLNIAGVVELEPRMANASRARDPQFDSAIIGNSTGQALRPSELSRLTDSRFVQLTVPGTGPREQLAILNFFVRHHPRIGALVMVTDAAWCTRDSALPPLNPFPFWLYGESTLEYVSWLFSSLALDRAWGRVRMGLGLRKRGRPDGYWDYETQKWREFQPAITAQDESSASSVEDDRNFSAVPLLDAAIKALPGDVPVVLVVPPMFYPLLPRPGSAAAASFDVCRNALKQLVAGRQRGNFLDYRVDTAATRDPANFLDIGHYRAKLARQMEQGIAASIRLDDKAKIEF